MLTQAKPNFTLEAKANITKSLNENWITEGAFCAKAIDLFKEKTGLKYVYFTPNGTLAIYLALLALDLPKGSKVLAPSFTFYGSITPIIFAGLVPVFVDCDMSTYQAGIKDLEAAIDNDVSAIMAVDIYGRSSPLRQIKDLCDKNNIKLIEDAAQAVGVYEASNHAGTFADITTFSLFADKSFSSGEGGLIATNNSELGNKIKLLRNQGRPNSGTFIHPSLGMNFRVTDLHGGLAFEQFNRWDEIRKQRQDTWSQWHQRLNKCEHVKIQNIGDLESSVPFRFAFTSEYKVEIEKFLTMNDVMVRGFFYPMHLQPQLQKFKTIECPNTEYLAKYGICLPLHNEVSAEIIEFISDGINKIG
jgi:perosamine synthetase